MPFILRGVTLTGVDSVYCPMKYRIEAWQRLGKDLSLDSLEKMTTTISLHDVIEASENMLKNNSYGRIVIDVNT